jgi:beta-glucanase (GH16 family)
MWPAFWLNPENKRWPPEIDVVEIVNNGRDTTKNSFHFVHGKAKGKGTPERSLLNEWGSYVPGCDYADGFHVFSVEWTKERVAHLVDGVVVSDLAYAWCHDDGSDAGPAHVLANLAVGGKWPGPPSIEHFPARLSIDYIRVWQR